MHVKLCSKNSRPEGETLIDLIERNLASKIKNFIFNILWSKVFCSGYGWPAGGATPRHTIRSDLVRVDVFALKGFSLDVVFKNPHKTQRVHERYATSVKILRCSQTHIWHLDNTCTIWATHIHTITHAHISSCYSLYLNISLNCKQKLLKRQSHNISSSLILEL